MASVASGRRRVAVAAAAFFGLFAVFQAALALGAPLGRFAWGGASPVLPASLHFASAGAAVLLSLAAAAMWARSGTLRPGLAARAAWLFNALLTVQLALNTLANLASSSPGERVVMGAATTIGFVLCAASLLPRRGADGRG
ncbi:hypothetical protein BH09PSE2_BH09PSE2_03720 [soil metagenome]